MVKQWHLCIMQSFHSGLFLTTGWQQQRSIAASLPGNGDARVSPQRPILHDCACDEDICIVHCQYDIMICCCALETQIWILSPIRMKMGVFCLKWQKRGVANKRHSRSGIALFQSLHSRPRPAGEDGRIYIRGAVGGQQRSSGVDVSCEEASSGEDTTRFREEGQRRGREG